MFTNKDILDIIGLHPNLSIVQVINTFLLDTNQQLIEVDKLRCRFSRIKKKYVKLRKSRTTYSKEFEDFLREEFPIEHKTLRPHGTSEKIKNEKDIVKSNKTKQSEKIKSYKRKNIRLSIKVKKLQNQLAQAKLAVKKSQQKDKNAKVDVLKNIREKYSSKLTGLNIKVKQQAREIKKLQKEKRNREREIQSNDLIKENKDLSETNCQLESQKKELDESVTYLEDLIRDSNKVQLFDTDSNTFTPNCVQTVLNLTDLKVPTNNVGNVIKEVASLCNVEVDRVPNRKTVDRINDMKSSICNSQLSELAEKDDLTMYSDETPKFGKKIEMYGVSTENDTYLLGLREMGDKSSMSVLNTFKEVLDDISDACSNIVKSDRDNIGLKLLSKIKNTMSDRAATEKASSVLIEEYRKDILPLVIEGWDQLTEQEKLSVSELNNFYCGLHILVSFAECCGKVFIKFENEHKDSPVGSEKVEHLKCYHKNESGTFRLLRTVSKVCAMGEDEKNGLYQQWRTFLDSKGIKKNLITRFKHNRFNLIFMMGASVYHHKDSVIDFLENVYGTKNSLHQAVLLDLKAPLLIAGARALGIFSKFITSPLWRQIEEKKHILDMNNVYLKLENYLKKMSLNASELLQGKNQPFDDPAEFDEVTRKLLNPDTTDDITQAFLEIMSTSIRDILLKLVSDHLPGGKYFQHNENLFKETASARRHNKLPEFIFGQLDNLMRWRPNATLFTNECFLLYHHNRTREWLNNLDEQTRIKMIENSRKESVQNRIKFKERLDKIKEHRLQKIEQAKKEKERLEKARMERESKLTQDLCNYGFWQSPEEMNTGLSQIHGEKNKKDCLRCQINFRKNVLKQKSDKKNFTLSYRSDNSNKYIDYTSDVLKQKLKNLIIEVKKSVIEETPSQRDTKIKLVGKQVLHKFEEDGIMKSYAGTVISVVPGFPDFYNIVYDDEAKPYCYNLATDLEKGDLEILG